MTDKKAIPSVSVTAPVIVGTRAEDVRPLMDMVKMLETHDPVDVAKAEAKRLNPYFSAMSAFLQRALDREAMLSEDRAALKKLSKKPSLSKLFNAMARYRKNTLISDVAVMPASVKDKGPASKLFERSRLDVPYYYNRHEFSFGFLQIFRRDKEDNPLSSTTLPTFFIDEQMVGNLTQASAKNLMTGIKEAMSFANHDMLHHFSLPIINSIVAKNFTPDGFRKTQMWRWSERGAHSNYYEEWAQAGHEHIVNQPENARALEALRRKVDAFFDRLEKLELKNKNRSKKQESKERHEAVDYYGTVMLHVLSRAFPLNHEIVLHAVERLEKADKASTLLAADWAKTMYGGDAPALHKVWNHAYESQGIFQTASNYKAIGLEIMPDDKGQLDYKKIKLLQLISLDQGNDDINAHIPTTEVGRLAPVRKEIGNSMLRMVRAAAQDAGMK